MNAKSKKLLGELEEVMLDLYRSASNLDNVIQQIKQNEETDKEYVIAFIQNVSRFRMDIKHARRYDSLDEQENDIWKRLIASIKNEET